MKRTLFSLFSLIILTASPAFAHTGATEVSGFVAGFSHPIGGLDHLLAMVAVGILATQMGGKSLWMLPLSFVATMLIGGIIAMSGLDLPLVETGIVGSVIIFGGVIALGRSLPVPAACALTGLLALFHGHAHGSEMPLNAGAAEYALGFIVATSLLHAIGIGASIATVKTINEFAPLGLRLSGGAIAVAGLLLILV